jgi:hypothetical protein
MPLSAFHKGILIGLVVGVVAYHFWARRVGGGSPPAGG